MSLIDLSDAGATKRYRPIFRDFVGQPMGALEGLAKRPDGHNAVKNVPAACASDVHEPVLERELRRAILKCDVFDHLAPHSESPGTKGQQSKANPTLQPSERVSVAFTMLVSARWQICRGFIEKSLPA